MAAVALSLSIVDILKRLSVIVTLQECDDLLQRIAGSRADAEVVAFDDLVKVGTMQAAKEKGLIRSEGKDYVMRDGDIVLFRFNVSK